MVRMVKATVTTKAKSFLMSVAPNETYFSWVILTSAPDLDPFWSGLGFVLNLSMR